MCPVKKVGGMRPVRRRTIHWSRGGKLRSMQGGIILGRDRVAVANEMVGRSFQCDRVHQGVEGGLEKNRHPMKVSASEGSGKDKEAPKLN